MSERPPTTMVRGAESEAPHLRVEMPRDVYKRLARAERQIAAVREVLKSCYEGKDECLAAGGSVAERAQAYGIIAHRLARALETE